MIAEPLCFGFAEATQAIDVPRRQDRKHLSATGLRDGLLGQNFGFHHLTESLVSTSLRGITAGSELDTATLPS
jgi:hypothetical protein